MIRRLLYDVLLFLLPFALYGAYLRLAVREGAEAEPRQTPWTILFISGLLLVAASFVWLGVTQGQGSRGVYVPAHVEDGRVVPGRVDTFTPSEPPHETAAP